MSRLLLVNYNLYDVLETIIVNFHNNESAIK